MLTATERSNLISKLRAFPEAMRAGVRSLTAEQLDTPYRAGGWTVRQVVHHLADAHLNAYVRFKLMLTEDHPTLKPYDQDEWAKLADVALPIEGSLAILDGLHQRWAHLLEQQPESVWQRAAYHPERGEVTLESLLIGYGHHCDNHLKQITDLRAASGW